MKTKIMINFLFLAVFTGAWIAPQKANAQGVSVSFQVFYDDLSPYGTWVDSPDYGYVWVPNVAPGFEPYATNGYWVFTDQGWTWVSNYSWGWAPFHYGRWYTDASYGPMWVPDNEWGPGWVCWRRSAGYYGWAPIGPGVSISEAYGSGYNIPADRWRFVRDRDFGRPNINNYYVNSNNNVTIIHNSTVINNSRVDRSRNVTYNGGPDRAEVEKQAGRKFTPVAIRESSKPGQQLKNNQLQIYRPQVQKTTPSGQKPAPAKVASLKDVKPMGQRTTGTPTINKANPSKQQQSQPKNTVQPNRQPTPPQKTTQPAKQQQPTQPQHNVQPAKQQKPSQQQHNAQPTKQQQPTQPQHNAQPPQQQHNAQPPQQQQQHNAQPPKQQQQAQPQHNAQPPQQQQQHNAQPPKQQQSQPQHNAQPPKQQPSQPQQHNPPKNTGDENQPHK